MKTNSNTNFYFESRAKGLSADTFRVVSFLGHEEISQPFRFEIELASEKPDIDLDDILRWPAFLGIEREGELRKIHGILAEFEQMREGPLDLYHYKAVLVPRLWLLSMSCQNQIYQNKSVPQIIEEELKGARNKGPAELATAGLTAGDFELRFTRKYSAREYTVQYRESDLDFISRLMEHEGIFYFFEHDDNKEKIIITDNNIHFPAMAEESKILYRPPSGMAAVSEESIRSISCRSRRMPKKVILKDYNFRTPHVPLQGEAAVDTKGHGVISEYGNHFKKPEEGILLARIRAEEIRCRQQVFGGNGDCSKFSPGHRYTLDEHYRQDFNREYVIIGVGHTGTQAIAGASGLGDEERQESSYRNEFTAICSDVPFRPERRTPKPKLYGIMHAHVDSALLEERAEIDEQGRYKVVMPFDLSGAGQGKASRYIRMAQPYGGKSQGMHFPLHKGTEVIWACVDGDPDRPIILGAVPNPLNPSVVTDSNYTKNVIRTASGSFLEFNDGPGLGAVVQKVTGSQLQRQQQYQKGKDGNENAFCTSSGDRLNRENTGKSGRRTDGSGMIRATREAGHQGQLEQQQQTNKLHVAKVGAEKYFRVKVPDYETVDDVGQDSYLRLGDTPTQQVTGMEETDDEEAGWFDYTDGVHTSVSGPTVNPADTSILEDPNPRRAEPPNVDAAMWTEYGVKTAPPSPYIEYALGKDFWNPDLNKEDIDTVMASKDTRYYPYWDEKTSKRQQYDADNDQWKYSYDVKKDDLVRGSHSEHVQGDRITEIEGTWDCTIKGHLYNTAWGHVHSDYYQSHSESYYGDVLDVYGQPAQEVKVTEIAYGPKYEWHFGNKVEVVEGNIYEDHKGNKTEYVEGEFTERHEGTKDSVVSGKVTENLKGGAHTIVGDPKNRTTDIENRTEVHANNFTDIHLPPGGINRTMVWGATFDIYQGYHHTTHAGLTTEASASVSVGISSILSLTQSLVRLITGSVEVHKKKAELKFYEGVNVIF
jgi:type VI secretion system VgrG family protein